MDRCFIITGVRGSGKTVFLTEIAEYLRKEEKWLVVDLNPERDMLRSLASKLYDEASLKHLFLKGEISFSLSGLTFSVSSGAPDPDVETIIMNMMEKLTKKGIKVLITVDEVTNSNNVKAFAHAFQSLLRAKMNAFLLMTGLYQNVENLQNQETLTFLYRSRKVKLPPLSLPKIAFSYENILSLSPLEAKKAAKETCGYAFAYQALGHCLYEEKETKLTKKVLSTYDLYLSQYVYEKIYSELSPACLSFCYAMKDHKKSEEIEKALSFTHGQYSVYRKILIDRGIINGEKRGEVTFLLPRFSVFLDAMKEFYD